MPQEIICHDHCFLSISAKAVAPPVTVPITSVVRWPKSRNRLITWLVGLTLATAELYQHLPAWCECYPQDLVAHACYIGEYQRSLKKMSKARQQDARQSILEVEQHINAVLDQRKTDELAKAVEWLLDKRHRASSAVEGFNAILRPYMYVRKGVNQGFLELFRAWHNLRTRRSGKHKGTSAYETLTGNQVDDWLTVLGFPPSSATH